MNQTDDNDLRIEAIPPAEEIVALAHLSPATDPRDRLLLSRPDDATDPAAWQLWGATRRGKLVAALRTHVQPDGTATLRLPILAAGETPGTRQKLLSWVIQALAAQNLRLAQTLVATSAGPDADLWRSCGFRHAAELVYLVSLSQSWPKVPPTARLTFSPWSTEQHERFVRVIEQTYLDSLDCRSVGAAPARAVLESYRAIGEFDPARWLLAADAAGDVGCVLLADYPALDEWELVYLGVVPAARGRGLGLAITRHAQWLASRAGRGRLTLAVDAANVKALDVYISAGFVEWDRRSIFVREF